MSLQELKRRLIPSSTHSELVQAMRNSGFAPLYRFIASTDKDRYHVTALHAQQTSHYFYLPGKGCVVQLTLSEHIDTRGYQQWWNVRTYFELDTRAMIEHEVRNICPNHEGPRFFMDDCEPLSHVMGSIEELLQPFRYIDSNHVALVRSRNTYGWAGEHSGSLTVQQVVSVAEKLREHFATFLMPKLVDFNAFSFTDTYSWPDINHRFWERFPNRILREVATGRISGRPSAVK